MSDLYTPVTKRLKQLTRDLKNAVNDVLAASKAANDIKETKIGVDNELKEAIDHLSAAYQQWQKLGSLVEHLTLRLGELTEADLSKLVESAADSAMVVEFVGQFSKLKEIETAHQMLHLDSDLIEFAVKEIASNDLNRLKLWQSIINRTMEDTNDS